MVVLAVALVLGLAAAAVEAALVAAAAVAAVTLGGPANLWRF